MTLELVKLPPSPVGYWCIGGVQGFRFAVRERPRWLTRVLLKALLEWEWRDANDI